MSHVFDWLCLQALGLAYQQLGMLTAALKVIFASRMYDNMKANCLV